MPKVKRSHQPYQPENSKRTVDVSRGLVIRSELTAEAAKSGIHPTGKAREGIHQHRISLTPPNKPMANKANQIYLRFFPQEQENRKR